MARLKDGLAARRATDALQELVIGPGAILFLLGAIWRLGIVIGTIECR